MTSAIYECSICQGRVPVGYLMAEHLEQHRQDPAWPGRLTWTLVSGDAPLDEFTIEQDAYGSPMSWQSKTLLWPGLPATPGQFIIEQEADGQ